MLKGKRIAFIGAGNMAEAMVKGLLASPLGIKSEDLLMSDIRKDRLDSLNQTYQIRVSTDNPSIVRDADIVVLSVKPQNIKEVLTGIVSEVTEDKLVISIAAGVKIQTIQDLLKTGVPVIRTMPNTPALVQAGATALAPGKWASQEDLQIAKTIFDAVGLTVIVEEKLLDVVTGLSGSGPAYVFLFINALADGGVKMGLPKEVALKLVAQTVLGAARLVLETGDHPAKLKDMVTSPGGTTIAGIHALEKGGLEGTLMDAVEAATLRSIELGR
jgi:pyrroline-5-carboxylate reductase